MPLSKRWEIVIMLHTAAALDFMLRVNLSVAVVRMRDELEWTERGVGFMLSSFYWGYAIGQMPSVIAVHRLDVKWFMGCALLITCALSILFPVLCSYSYALGFTARLCMGLSASVNFPSIFYFYTMWIPSNERTIMVALIMSGAYLGEVISFWFSGYLVSTTWLLSWYYNGEVIRIDIGGWPSAFWFFGALGFLWFPIWMHYVYEAPSAHPFISEEELTLFLDYSESMELEALKSPSYSSMTALPSPSYQQPPITLPDLILPAPLSSPPPPTPDRRYRRRFRGVHQRKPHFTLAEIPWMEFFTHPASITLLINSWTLNWIAFMLLSELPSYLSEVFAVNIKNAGMLSLLPFAAQFAASLIFGQIFQALQEHCGWSTRTYTAFAGSGICLLIFGFLNDPNWAISVMVIGLMCFGAAQSGIMCAYLDLTPKYSTTLNTIANIGGSIAALVSPLLISSLKSFMPLPWGWRSVFGLTGLQCLISLIFWSLYQTSDPIDFDDF